MKKKVKIIVAAVAVVAALAAGIAYAVMPVRVETSKIDPSPVSLTFTEQGTYTYRRVYTLYPLISGEVLEVRVEEGDTVREGDVIAVVSAEDYEYQILQLESAIAGYNGQISNLWLQDQQRKDELGATLENLQGQLVSLEAEIENRERGTDSLAEQIAIQEAIVGTNSYHVRLMREDLRDARDSDDDDMIDQARQAYNAARNTLAQSELVLEQLRAGEVPAGIYEGQRQSLEAQISSVSAQLGKSYTGGMYSYYNAQIAAAQSSIEQMRNKSGQAEITAPRAGVISKLPIGDQNLISQSAPVALIGNDPFIEVFVPVREIDGVAVGDEVELILDKRTGKETVTGSVVEINTEAEVKLSALGVEERKVRVLVRPASNSLQIGYEMDVRFTVELWENALVAPKTAVFPREGGDWVWVLEDGVITARPVTTGAETREGYLITEGLSGGEEVVTDASADAVAEGKRAVGG